MNMAPTFVTTVYSLPPREAVAASGRPSGG